MENHSARGSHGQLKILLTAIADFSLVLTIAECLNRYQKSVAFDCLGNSCNVSDPNAFLSSRPLLIVLDQLI